MSFKIVQVVQNALWAVPRLEQLERLELDANEGMEVGL
jgi:hypothetical protein